MRLFYRLAHVTVGLWIRLHYRVKVEGLQHLPPDRGVILASNHQSNWDPVVIACALPREIFFLAKKELFSFGPFGWLLRTLNTIPIERGVVDQSAMKAVRRTLGGGRDLIFFPEGTRSKDGRLRPFRKGIGMVSSLSRSPVLPVMLHGTWQKGRLFGKRPEVQLVFGQVLEYDQLRSTGLKGPAAYPAMAAKVREPIEQAARQAGMEVLQDPRD